MNGKTNLRWLQFGISFLVRALSIATICLIPLLLVSSQAKAEGPVIVGPQVDIYVGPGEQRVNRVAFDSINNRFLVVWDDERIYGGARDVVYGQMVNADGTLYGIPITISVPHGIQQLGPIPAFDPVHRRFLVIWSDNANAYWKVYGQFVSGDGSLWGENFLISPLGQWVGPSFVGFDSINNRFLVLWATGPGTPSNLFAQFVNADGSLPAPPFPITNYTSGYGVYYSAAAYDSNHERFLIAYGNDYDGHINGRLLNADGTFYGEEFAIGDNMVTSVTFDSSNNRFLVIWGTAYSNFIKGRLVNADGTLFGSEFVIADYPSGGCSTVFDNASNAFLLVGHRGSEKPIFGQFLDPDGGLYGSRFTILDTGYHGPICSFAAFGSGETGSLVVWSDQPYAETGSDIFGKFVRLSAACLVTNTNDGGLGSLRQCLLDAHSGDTITFDPSVFPPASPATIALTSAYLKLLRAT